MIEFATQIILFGHAITGDQPRDPMTLWIEDRVGWVEHHWPLWDYTAEDLDRIQVSGQRPPPSWALMPAKVAELRS